MKFSRIFWPLLLLLAALMIVRPFSAQHMSPSNTPLTQAKVQSTLTPASAAQIAKERFPDSQIQTILLVNNGDSYAYQVTVHTVDQGLYQLHIALSDGHIHEVSALEASQPNYLPLAALAQQVMDDYPAAQLLTLELQRKAYFPYYQAKLQQDRMQITLFLQPTDGMVLKEQRSPADAPLLNSPAKFGQILPQAAAVLPSKQLIGLSLSPAGGYHALYQDDSYRYDLHFDDAGNELERTTSQLSTPTSGLAQGSIAPAE